MARPGPERSFSTRPYRGEGRRVRPGRGRRRRGPNPWIIVGSILGGVVLLGLLIALVVSTSEPPASNANESSPADENSASGDKIPSLFPLPTGRAQPAENATPPSAIPGGVREPASEFIQANLNRVRADVRAINQAAAEGNMSMVLDYTSPKLIEYMGGRARAELALSTVYLNMRSVNLRFESLSFPEPPRFLETNENYYAIVPVKSIMTANGQRIEIFRYQLGILKKGTLAWKYIDGSGTNKRLLRTLVPDLPPDVEFPKIPERRL